jgi:hypothetical protein
MNAGALVSTLRVKRVSESGTRGVSGSAPGLLGLPEKEGREKERGTPDNCTVCARMSFCE